MKRLIAGALTVVVIALSACGNKDEPIDVVTPTPWGTPAPTPTDTPSQAELSAMAEETYRTFFKEWKRLEREGGATEPSDVMRQTASDQYLEGVMALLRDQEQSQYSVSGPMATARVVPAPGGDFTGVDARLTLKVCEDSSQTTYTVNGTKEFGYPVEGLVYLKLVDGTPRVVAGATRKVEQCTF